MRPGQKQFWFGLIVVKYTRFENKRNEVMHFLVSNLSNQGVNKKRQYKACEVLDVRSLVFLNDSHQKRA